MILASDIITTTKSAIQKPSISKELPIKESANNNVIAFMTKRNNPSDKIVTGKVKIIKNGRTNIFKIDSKKLAPIAAPNPDI